MSTQLADPAYLDDLGHGLIRRWSTAANTEKIGLLLSSVHRDRADEPLNVISQDLARIFMSGNFLFMDDGDFAIVEDASQPTRPIVACTCLWRHQLYAFYPDVWADAKTKLLIDTLFPKLPSNVLEPLG